MCLCVCTCGCAFASRKNDKYTENISWFATNIATLCHSCQNAMTSIKHTAMLFDIFHMQIFERNRICINQHIVEIIWPKCCNVRWIFRRSQSKLHAFNWAIWFIVCSIPHRCTHLISIYAHINYLNTNSIMGRMDVLKIVAFPWVQSWKRWLRKLAINIIKRARLENVGENFDGKK